MAKNFQATGSERAKILKYLKDLFHWRLRRFGRSAGLGKRMTAEPTVEQK